jgi:16S rRNA (cytosine967-C5)-methyltransferase
MKEAVQIKIFENIISEYNHDQPLSRFLADYFKKHKQMGSRDRRLASRLAYNYFRVYSALSKTSTTERLAISCFLCDKEPDSFLAHLFAEFPFLSLDKLSLSTEEKFEIVENSVPNFKSENLFPFSHLLSKEIEVPEFTLSLLKQPNLWIRVRKAYKDALIKELTEKNIEFEIDSESPLCFKFKNSFPADQLESFKKGYFEIQDRSSQLTSNYFNPHPKEHWWDCCAASGGKSLALLDIEPAANPTVSDIRESVLNNLKVRFSKSGIRNYRLLNIDLTNTNQPALTKSQFDGIIADVPCSGSGTWSRTPEMTSNFKESSLTEFQKLQKSIVSNVVKYLKPGKPLIYITCSVFKKENEDIIEYLKADLKLTLEKSEYIKGYDKGADTMFVARLIKQ